MANTPENQERVPKWLERDRICALRRMESELGQRLREVRREIATAAEDRKRFIARRSALALDADRTDHMIMLWARRHPRVAASNAPTGEHINYGGRAQA